MLFIITRTSIFNDEEAPHPKAHKKVIPDYEMYENWTEHYFNINNSKQSWRSVGSGHTTINNGLEIKRQLGTNTVWVISFNSISKLMEFVISERRIIIQPPAYDIYPRIEIYDDYRE